MAASMDEPLDAEVLSDIAAGLAHAVDQAGAAGAAAGARRAVLRERLLATDGYDAWLLAWPAGAETDMHDHNGSVGVMHVVVGELVEVHTRLEGGTRVRSHHDAGSTSTTGVDQIHSLHNPGATASVSVHVYSPPLGECR